MLLILFPLVLNLSFIKLISTLMMLVVFKCLIIPHFLIFIYLIFVNPVYLHVHSVTNRSWPTSGDFRGEHVLVAFHLDVKNPSVRSGSADS